jgi:hypothetical protein
MLIQDYEWAGAYIKDGQFIGQLVVTPSFYLPGAQQDFDQLGPRPPLATRPSFTTSIHCRCCTPVGPWHGARGPAAALLLAGRRLAARQRRHSRSPLPAPRVLARGSLRLQWALHAANVGIVWHGGLAARLRLLKRPVGAAAGCPPPLRRECGAAPTPRP